MSRRKCRSGQPGPITRLLSCNPEDLERFKDLEGINTHVAPSWTRHPRTGDIYRHALCSCAGHSCRTLLCKP